MTHTSVAPTVVSTTQPGRKRRRRARSALAMVVQVGLIALGVFLGLAGEEWRQDRENHRLASETLQRFRTELATNRDEVLRVKDYQDQIQTQAKELAVLNQTLEQRVAERTLQLERVLDGTVQAVALTVEMRDPYTAGHQRRVS